MSSLRDKMLNYESVPPRETWDKIAAALDEAHQGEKFPGTLRNMEVPAPSPVWDRIAASLEEEESSAEKPVLHSSSGFRLLIRYAAAAVIIGGLAFGILRWTGNTDKSNTGTASLPAVSGEMQDTTRNNLQPADTQQLAETSADAAEIPGNAGKKLVAKLERAPRTSTKRFSPAVQSEVLPSPAKLTNTIYTYSDRVPSVADRYIMLMTPDGNLIRMSKKWGSLVCCVSGEDPDADCRSQLKKWQEKMASSSLITASGNFMDVLNLVSTLEEGSDL